MNVIGYQRPPFIADQSAYTVPGHVQDVELPINESQGRWTVEPAGWLWRQTANPGAVQIKNEHRVHVCARQTMLSFVYYLAL